MVLKYYTMDVGRFMAYAVYRFTYTYVYNTVVSNTVINSTIYAYTYTICPSPIMVLNFNSIVPIRIKSDLREDAIETYNNVVCERGIRKTKAINPKDERLSCVRRKSPIIILYFG